MTEHQKDMQLALQSVYIHYLAEVLSSTATNAVVVVQEDAQLPARVRGRKDPQPTIITRGTRFFLASAQGVTPDQGGGGKNFKPHVVLTLRPHGIAEYVTAALDPDTTAVKVVMESRTENGLTIETLADFQRFVADKLSANCPGTGKTYMGMIQACLDSERRRVQRENIENVAHFGDW